ncbi:MAG: cytochrome c nitrite reductase small subunit, partial [Deltaproteobacteria bacterium]|nr:cytochrome c nitrite reductase small subunit [Deltaproteobacteria bacterium]
LAAGLAVYTFYASLAASYLSERPAVCANCHIMGPYFQSWLKSSHNVWANCNDCHVPNDTKFRYWAFKAFDGLYHSAVFTLRLDTEVIRQREISNQVVYLNCLRCHSPLVTEYLKMGPDYRAVTDGRKKVCWDCHQDLPHTRNVSVNSIVYGNLPLPPAALPAWLAGRTETASPGH